MARPRSTTGKRVKKRSYTEIVPWGKLIPQMMHRRGRTVSKSSSRKPSKSSPQLAPQTKGYPANKPSQWPVEPDFENHTLAPPLSGLDQEAADAHNDAVEQAYNRAGYQ